MSDKFFKLFPFIGRLHAKVLAMMVLVGVIPLLLVGILAILSLNVFHKTDVASIESNLINGKVEEILRFFNEIIGTFELRVSFEQTSDIELSNQHFLLQGLLNENQALEEAAFISLNGMETSRYSRIFPKGLPQEEFQDQSSVPKFIRAKNGQNYVSPIYFTVKGPMVTVASPVRNRNDVIISVLTGEINLSELQKIVQESRLGALGYLYVVEQDGFLIAHSKSEIMKATVADLRESGFIRELLDGSPFLGAGKQMRYQSFWGEKVVAAGDYLANFNLGIVAEWPTSDADKIVNTVRNQVLIASFLVLILTVILSIFLSNRIIRPIKILEAGTKLIAEGKFDQPVNIASRDELEDLGIAFNKMMEGLKRFEELKNEFVFIAAHEIRTPVTAIKGYISMVLEDQEAVLDEKVKKFLNEVKKASERLNNLVNDLLQIARSEAGRLEIKVGPIDVAEPIGSVLAELKVLADEKSIKLIYEPAAALPKAMADSQRLKEVMVNLVGNAIKYTLGAGTVTVFHEIKDKELITHVKDTGMGMSPEAQKKLFEKFYRVQTEKTQSITGTGLGLFIVKEIVEKMKGRIWAVSEEGKGSTFSFSLPIA